MLIHANPLNAQARSIAGEAHIVIALGPTGLVRIEAFFKGRPDSSYACMTDARMLERELPKLIAELRDQLSSSRST